MQEKLRKEDLNWCIKRLPKRVQRALKDYSCNLVIGGGFIRSCITGDKLKDIDLFVNSFDTAKKVNTFLKDDDKKRDFKTQNAYTVFRGAKTTLQIIHRWQYPRPEDILNDFDFTICCSAIWYENGDWQSAIHPLFYADLAAKRLRYTEPSRIEEAGGSMLRVLKYYNKGYKIMLTSFAKVIARCTMGVKQVKDNIDEHQLAKVINGLLVEVDPNAIGEDDFIRDLTEEMKKEEE